jgi:hypothetical protein
MLVCTIKLTKLLRAAALDEVPLLVVVERGEGGEPFYAHADCWLPFFLVDPRPVLAQAL